MKIEAIRRQSLISFIFSFLMTFIGLIATMYFAHSLGPAILGIYFLFISYFSIFQLAGDSGIGYAAIKRISEGNEPHHFFTAFAFLRIALLAISIGVIFLLSGYIETLKMDNIWILLILSLCISNVFNIFSVDVYALDKVGIYQTGVFVNFVLKIIFQILLVLTGFALGGLLWGFICGYIGGLLFYFPFLELNLTKISRFHIKDLINYSVWIGFSNNSVFLITTVEILIVGFMLTTTDVGIFSISLQLSSAVLMVTTAICSVIFPKISLLHTQGDTPRIKQILTHSFTYSLVFGLPIAVGGLIIGDRLLYFLYGSSFDEGYYPLIALFLVQLVIIFLSIQITVLNATNRANKVFPILAFSTILCILGNILLIPIFGLTGGAIALLATVMVFLFLLARTFSDMLIITYDIRTIIRIIFPTMLMAIALMIIRKFIPITSWLILAGVIVIGAIVYFILLFSINKLFYEEGKQLFRIIVE